MKCPTCGGWTTVHETRGTRRRRECANGHRFSTEERVVGVMPGGRHQKWARNQAIRQDPRGASELARVHGISEAAIRQIRKGTRGGRLNA